MERKVCQISSAHRRYDARIFRKIATTLRKSGYESFFLIMDKKPNETIDGVQIVSIGRFFRSNIMRIIFASFLLRKKALQIDADLYQIHDPELFKLGFYLKKKGKKVIFDCHEDYRYIAEKKYLPKPFRRIVLAIYLKKEKKVCREFDSVITVTPTVFNRLQPFCKRISMITNYPCIIQDFGRRTLTAEPTICFGGNCGWMHKTLLEVLQRFKGRLRYEFATNPLDPALVELKKCEGWKYVDFLGYLKFDDLRKIYGTSWIGFAVFPYCAVVNHNEGTLGNTKIFEYMMDGLPVVCSDHSIWKGIIEKENCGIAVKPDDADALYEAIDYLISHKEKLREMGRNGRKAALSTYNWSTQEPILLSLYNCLLNEN